MKHTESLKTDASEASSIKFKEPTIASNQLSKASPLPSTLMLVLQLQEV